jgi:hypothetical protein
MCVRVPGAISVVSCCKGTSSNVFALLWDSLCAGSKHRLRMNITAGQTLMSSAVFIADGEL